MYEVKLKFEDKMEADYFTIFLDDLREFLYQCEKRFGMNSELNETISNVMYQIDTYGKEVKDA